MASLGMEVSEEISATDSVHQDLGHSALMTPGNDDGSFAVRITPLSSFVSNLPNSFSCHSQSAEPRLKMAISPSQPDDLVVCIEQNMLNCHRLVFPENRGRVLMSCTVNQMNGLAYQLVSRPLLMIVRVMYRMQRNTKWHVKVEHLVVLINTKHPSVQSQLEGGLRTGLSALIKQKQFAIELNFNFIIAKWLKSVLYREHLLWTTSTSCQFFVQCEGASLVITNCSEYSKLFDIRSPDCCCWWMFCLPCCLVMCPSYTVTRCITVDDHLVKVKAEASYWDLEGHGDPDEAVMHLREILCGENVDWNQIHDHMMRTFHEERLRASRAERRRETDHVSSSQTVVSSQPQRFDYGDLPSYEEAVLISGRTNFAMAVESS